MKKEATTIQPEELLKPIFGELFGQQSFMASAAITTIITQELFTSKDTGISRRNLSYWDKEGLLLSKRADTLTWRRFSFLEYVWLCIVDDLRLMGCPISIIQKFKSYILAEISYKGIMATLRDNREEVLKETQNSEEREMLEAILAIPDEEIKDGGIPLLAMLINHVLSEKLNISLIVCPNGTWLPLTPGGEKLYSKKIQDFIYNGVYTRVSLTSIITGFLSDDLSGELLAKLTFLDHKEQKLLEIINTGDYDTITIHFKNKKMDALELTKKQDVKRKIADILQENEYQEVVIKRHKGLTTTIENTTKVFMEEKKK